MTKDQYVVLIEKHFPKIVSRFDDAIEPKRWLKTVALPSVIKEISLHLFIHPEFEDVNFVNETRKQLTLIDQRKYPQFDGDKV